MDLESTGYVYEYDSLDYAREDGSYGTVDDSMTKSIGRSSTYLVRDSRSIGLYVSAEQPPSFIYKFGVGFIRNASPRSQDPKDTL